MSPDAEWLWACEKPFITHQKGAWTLASLLVHPMSTPNIHHIIHKCSPSPNRRLSVGYRIGWAELECAPRRGTQVLALGGRLKGPPQTPYKKEEKWCPGELRKPRARTASQTKPTGNWSLISRITLPSGPATSQFWKGDGVEKPGTERGELPHLPRHSDRAHHLPLRPRTLQPLLQSTD